ncbi:MAG: cytidylate kinase family protein, partial [Firmicutes bacterium]|nr:cytidylate kinase family protein [Candidatus Caballimonas caccae]
MELDKQKFLGEQKISKLMLKFSLPCVLSLMINALYNIVDTIFIGNSKLNVLGTAATGVVFPLFVITQAFAWCFGDGSAAHLNICQGKGDSKNASKVIGTGITSTIIVGILLISFLLPFKREILFFMGASSNNIDYAEEYLGIIVFSFPFYMLAEMLVCIVRADGSPAWSMFSMVSGAIINIILDPIFIMVLDMGMFGAGLATAIGQAVSSILAFSYFFRTKTFKLKLKDLIPNFKELMTIMKLGLSSFTAQITIVVIALICDIQLKKYGALSIYGEDIPLAIISVQNKIFAIIINIVVGVVLGCQPIISYNMGAQKFDRLKELFKKILLLTVIVGLFATLLFEIFPNAIVSIFGLPKNVNEQYYWEFGRKVFRIFLSLVSITCAVKMTSIFYQSCGKPVHAVLCSLIRDALFVPMMFVFPIIFNGIDGLLWASPVADLISLVVIVILSVNFWKGIKEVRKYEETETVIKQSKEGAIITIAREHGSMGKQIGRIVSEKLNIPFYYKETTALAAQESGLSKQFISDINKNAPAIFKKLYLGTEVISQAVVAQEEIIKKIASYGSCVIVGRSADYVLKDNKDVVKVFIYAPMEFRIQNVMKAYNDSKEDAIKYIKKSDKARASYYKNVSGLTWGDEKNYDLIIDSSIGIEESAEKII